MNKTLGFLLVLIITATSAIAADAPYYGYEKRVINGKVWTVPDYINITRFPPNGGKLTSRDALMLDVHLEPLQEAGWFANEIRTRHTFEIIWIEVGEMVWVSNGGHEPRYLASCGNRISPLLAHQISMLPAPAPRPQPSPTPAPGRTGVRLRPMLRWLGEAIKDLFLYGPFMTAQ